MTAKNKTQLLGMALLLTLVLSACRAPVIDDSKSPTLDLNALYTQVAGTLIAQGGAQAATNTPASLPTQTPIVITATSSPTSVSAATNTPANTSVPSTSVPSAPVCNQAAFITDVTVKDGTVMDDGEDFTKTWRIKNVGTCAWTTDYNIVYASGINLASKSSFDMPEKVDPGETVDISIPMEAPDDNGTYKSNWWLQSSNGTNFGVGGSGSNSGVPIFALIRVGPASSNNNNNNGDTDVRYDFASHYCDAKWSSDDDSNLPCPGANSGNDGFVIVLQNPELESRDEDEPAIWMQPNRDNNGFIRGVFPNFEVKNNDVFVAEIGCLDNNNNCRVQFTLSYILNGNEHQLGSWDEKFDGLSREVEIDLSSLAGKTVKFVLMVEPNNNSYNQANGFWFMPQIVK
jgi:hypothetical protein